MGIYIDSKTGSIIEMIEFQKIKKNNKKILVPIIDPVFKSIYILTQKQGQYIYIRNSDVSIDIYILTLFLSQYIIRTCIVAEGAERPSAAISVLTLFSSQYICIDPKTGSI